MSETETNGGVNVRHTGNIMTDTYDLLSFEV